MSTSAEKSPKPPSTVSRAPGEAFFPAARGGGFFGPVVQAKLTVSKPGDALEKEADRTAEQVMRMPAPAASPVLIQPADRDNSVSRAGAGASDVSADAQSAIQKATTGGRPLSPDVRDFVEPRLGADFSQVRIHTDGEAASLSNRLGARAFTHRNHIFFGRDQYQPGSSDGRQLLFHELTHTIQQGHSRQSATMQRSPKVTTTASPPAVQRLGIQDALDYFADNAYYIPGFRMLTLLLGFNPINMRSADRTAANLLRALIELLPGGAIITQVLDNHGVINKAAAWVEQKIATLGDIGAQIVAGLARFIDSLGWSDIFDLGDVWDRAKRIFTDPIGRLISFGASVVTEILQMVKDAILRPLAALAEGTPGYDLLKAILGQDPITGEPVPRNADTLIGGFMKLIGQEEVWQNLKKGNAVTRAWAWFQNALTGLMGLVRAVPRKIIDTLRSLTFQDVITVVGAFRKVVGAFVTIATDFISWGVKQVLGLLEILFSVVAPRAMPYIAKAKAAFHTIIRDPVRFVGNLVRAAKLGFQMFANNIVEHLKNALIKWITGPLGEAGVYIPKSFSLMEIVKLVLSVLGLTWQNIRAKLVKIIPEPVLTALEKTAKIVVTLVTEGPAAAWEQIKSELTELKDQLIGQVTQMISTEVVKAAVTKLVSMLNPAGAVIQAIIATYNTVTFFIEKINQIAAVVASFIDSIAAIASGQVQGAAKKVEQTMASTLTVIIAFLAKFVGLGNVPTKLVGVVKKIRQPIDKGLDRIVGWLGGLLQKLSGKDGKGTDTAASKKVKQDAIRDATAILKGKEKVDDITPVLDSIRRRYQPQGLKSLSVSAAPDLTTISITATASPGDEIRIPFEAVFRGMSKVKIEELRKVFENKAKEVYGDDAKRNYVIAAITVDGNLIGQAEYNDAGSGIHAERVLGPHWRNALDTVADRVAKNKNKTKRGAPYERPQLVFALSASPCQECAKVLKRRIAEARSHPVIGNDADFILAIRTAYEGKMDPKKKTLSKDIVSLVDLGWDLKQLATKVEFNVHWEGPIIEIARKLAKQVNKAGK